MNLLLSAFILLPLLSFFISLTFANKQEKSIWFIVQITTVAYVLGSIVLAVMWGIRDFAAINERLVTLYKTDDFLFAIQFYYDGITAVYSVVGALIFFLVASFSRFYMHRDEGYKRFFNTLLVFLTGYNLIIFSGNFETLFIGWEIIGLSSFLLIAFYRNRYLPVKNGLKVISIYRISDVALILSMWMLHHLTHQNISFTQLVEAKTMSIDSGHSGMALFVSIMIVLAAIAKSAQLPFTSWLPRAMEGPTSSSAIFYGSLSIHIGVFLLLRTYPFWEDILGIKITVALVGALTAVIATSIARVQPTVKTQIAYSSAAQIGIMFIEIALGFHVLALVHFAGNAFLRTYQLLVSPSILNYLIHHQYFHFKPNPATGNSKWVNTFYTLGIKEWNIDTFLYKNLWMPFKHIGRSLKFLETTRGKIISFFVLGVLILFFGTNFLVDSNSGYFGLIAIFTALLLILYSFTSRASASTAWMYLFVAHLFILSGIIANMDEVKWEQVIMYASGVLLAAIVGFISLQRVFSIDRNINLDQFHGYVYEKKGTALLFLLAAIGLLGFPITAAFIGIDVFFTHIDANQSVLITLTALCFLFIELAAIRIYCRIFLGLHKKLYHPVAFRSS